MTPRLEDLKLDKGGWGLKEENRDVVKLREKKRKQDAKVLKRR